MTRTAEIDERAVVDVWERQAFDMSALAVAGLRVLFRGSPSDAGGPDYQDAMLIRGNRELIAGDVEFHVRTADWIRHGHHRDSRYNRVILHVVWQHDGTVVCRQDGIPVHTLELASCAARLPIFRSALLPSMCTSAYASMTTEAVHAVVHQCGRQRFEQRSQHLAADLSAMEPNQVLYCALLEACGYASNRSAFRQLSDAAPYAWVMGLPAARRLPALLYAAGLGPPSPDDPPARLPSTDWRLARLRPSNHPARRLAGICDVLARHGPDLAHSLARAVVTAPSPSGLRRALSVAAPEGAIGPGRADEIAVSVVLPFTAALGFPDEAWNLYSRYPSPPANRWTRHMLRSLAEAGHDLSVRSAVDHQGLHYLYHSYCRSEGKTGCPICRGGK